MQKSFRPIQTRSHEESSRSSCRHTSVGGAYFFKITFGFRNKNLLQVNEIHHHVVHDMIVFSCTSCVCCFFLLSQSVSKAASEQHQSSIGEASKKHQSSIRVASKQHQSSFKAASEQHQSIIGEASKQHQSDGSSWKKTRAPASIFTAGDAQSSHHPLVHRLIWVSLNSLITHSVIEGCNINSTQSGELRFLMDSSVAAGSELHR